MTTYNRRAIPCDLLECIIDQHACLEWLNEYYERGLKKSDITVFWNHLPLSLNIVERLRPDIAPWSVVEDALAIGFPLAESLSSLRRRKEVDRSRE